MRKFKVFEQTIQSLLQAKNNAEISPIKSNFIFCGVAWAVILNQKGSSGNNLKRIRYTRQGTLKRDPNLERAHSDLISWNL